MFHASSPASGGLLAMFGIPCNVDVSLQSFTFIWHFFVSLHIVFPLCMSVTVSKFSLFYKDTSHWIRTHPDDFILTWSSIGKDYLQIRHILKYWREDFNISFFGGYNSIHNTLPVSIYIVPRINLLNTFDEPFTLGYILNT